MVDIVMRLGHQLGLEVIAEGVTNPTELAAVVAAGCRFGQGALFGWGVPAEHLEAMLEAATSAGGRATRCRARRPPAPARAVPLLPRRGRLAGRPPAGQRPPTAGISRRWTGSGTATPGDERATSVNQDVGSVDSSREMRQA